MQLIQARNIHKTYRLGRVDVPVLRGASIAIEEGECVAILGASGSGKSTLLHILGGLDRPDARADSAVLFRGKPLESFSYKSVVTGGAPGVPTDSSSNAGDASRGTSGLNGYRNAAVGFVFQFYHLLPELNVTENVTIGAMVRYGIGYPGRARETRARAQSLLDAFGLGHRLTHRPAELSGGERQRVAIARALINDPPLLLADEPTGNLDRKTGSAILDSLAEYRASTRRTMVIVTHDEEVARRTDRIVRLEDGRIAGVGMAAGADAAVATT